MPPAPSDASRDGLLLIRAGLDALREQTPPQLPATVLGRQLAELETLMARLRAEQARRVAAFDSAGGPAADGFPTAASWLRANTLASPGEARDLATVAGALRDRLPASARALSEGGISFTAATAITRALRDVRDPHVLHEADTTLAALAPTLHPAQVPHAARRLLEHLDPQLAQRDTAQRWKDRTLTLAPMLDGALSVSGQLDETSAAVVLSALTPMMTPRGPEDTRTAGQRRADALVELVGKAAQIGAAGTITSTGLPPTLLVRVDIERLAQLDSPGSTRGSDDGHRDCGPDHGSGTYGRDASPGACGSDPSGPATRARAPLAEADWGGPVLDDTLQRIGCNAQLVRLVTAGPSRVLDLGRARRLASPAQNLARLARDNGCLFPGCDRPPEWTEAHHLRPWSEGGPTDLDGLLSLCAYHHHLIHEDRWSLRRTPAGLQVVRPDGTVHGAIELPCVPSPSAAAGRPSGRAPHRTRQSEPTSASGTGSGAGGIRATRDQRVMPPPRRRDHQVGSSDHTGGARSRPPMAWAPAAPTTRRGEP
jgi:hypothetical protein